MSADLSALVEKWSRGEVTEISYPKEWSDRMTGADRDTLEALIEHIWKLAQNECASELRAALTEQAERERKLAEVLRFCAECEMHKPEVYKQAMMRVNDVLRSYE